MTRILHLLAAPLRLVALSTILVATAAIFAACDWEDDYSPVTLKITVHDAAGADLFDPATPDNLLDKGIVLQYAGRTYTLSSDNLSPYNSRAYLAFLDAPVIYHNTQGWYDMEGKYFCSIGEWAGDEHHDEKATITWPDGTTDELAFTLRRKGVDHAKYYLNGERHEGSRFDFLYPRRK